MSAIKVKITDETAAGKIENEILLSFQRELITVRDLIKERVFSEVEIFNGSKPEFFKGLVQPSDTEKTLNGFRMLKRKALDAEQQYYIALEAYQRNGFFILVNDEQVDSLDQEVLLSDDSKVSFVKLTQLVGG